jgi:fatty acid desaturase
VRALAQDPRLRDLAWRDLLPLGRREIARELLLSPPWLAGSLAFAAAGLWLPALGCSFFFFLAGIRQAHGAEHGTLGLSRRATDAAMFVLSGLMLGSIHAVQVTHLRHHSRCLEEDDVEGFTARVGPAAALLLGPLFAARLAIEGLRLGSPAQRRWIRAELAMTGLVVAAALTPLSLALTYHVAAMLAGHCLTGFFLVWTVHHDIDPRTEVARTLRGMKALPFLHMFFHLEHHLYPGVPTGKLPELARRIDRLAPELQERAVF